MVCFNFKFILYICVPRLAHNIHLFLVPLRPNGSVKYRLKLGSIDIGVITRLKTIEHNIFP